VLCVEGEWGVNGIRPAAPAGCAVVRDPIQIFEDGHPDDLMKMLDRDVTVIDPRDGEAEHARDFLGVRTMADFEHAANESLDRRIKSKKDVPMIEDFPLAPEEETPEFRDLAMTLQLRVVRAVEHWKGNTHLTLTAIIKRMVEESMRKGEAGAGGTET
jgi:hypothetical protein